MTFTKEAEGTALPASPTATEPPPTLLLRPPVSDARSQPVASLAHQAPFSIRSKTVFLLSAPEGAGKFTGAYFFAFGLMEARASLPVRLVPPRLPLASNIGG